jgi:metal-sulfur cluster biosynthetic enzyme
MTNPTAPTSLPPTAETIRDALRRVIDPEVGSNIVDMGLVYRVEVGAESVAIDMTMTSPACPMADLIMEDVQAVLQKQLPPNLRLELQLVWSPPWDPEMMSHDAKQQFGW